MIAAIVVEGYLYVGLLQLGMAGQAEGKILDADASLYPHVLVVGLYGAGFVGIGVRVGVEVVGAEKQWETVMVDEAGGVGEEEV